MGLSGLQIEYISNVSCEIAELNTELKNANLTIDKLKLQLAETKSQSCEAICDYNSTIDKLKLQLAETKTLSCEAISAILRVVEIAEPEYSFDTVDMDQVD